MNTQTITSEKTTTSFRLNRDLVERLRSMARRNNRSLNNFVVTVLYDVAYNEPNEETIEAINEARSGKKMDRFEYAAPEETTALMTDLVDWYNQAEASGKYSPIRSWSGAKRRCSRKYSRSTQVRELVQEDGDRGGTE